MNCINKHVGFKNYKWKFNNILNKKTRKYLNIIKPQYKITPTSPKSTAQAPSRFNPLYINGQRKIRTSIGVNFFTYHKEIIPNEEKKLQQVVEH